MAWSTQGILTNPISGQLLADTGSLNAAFVPTLMLWSTAACRITLHHRNAANTLDLHIQQMSLSTEGIDFQMYNLSSSITLGANERLTLTLDVGFIGQIQCSIITS